MWFRKGPLFYAAFNIRLAWWLLFSKCDILLANDLDTLPANILAGKIRRKPVVYDSHEFFTEVPELIGRPMVRKIWEWLERRLLPHVRAAYTVCDSIAGIYSHKYGIPFSVIRNLPFSIPQEETKGVLGDDRLKPAIIYQGALNLGRGLENAIRAMRFIPEAQLILAGGGDKESELRQLASTVSPDNVIFTGRLPLEKLTELTSHASLGISLEEDLGLNYRYALPNKLFDYIQARIPVMVSDLPEMRKIVETYQTGMVADSSDPEKLASLFREALFNADLRATWKPGLDKAALELTWENEKSRLAAIFTPM